MGLFSGKTIITVSSTLYNMAGPEEDRPNYLKGTLFSSIMSNAPSLGDSITDSYFDGPGLKQRQFFKYAERRDLAGFPTSTVSNTIPVNSAIVEPLIPVPVSPAGLAATVQNAQVNEGDFEAWIKRWVMENHPSRIVEDFLGDYNETTDTFSVEFPNSDFFSWANNIAPIYDPQKKYVEAQYFLAVASNDQPLVEGSVVSINTLPDLTGFTQQSDTGTFVNELLTRNRTTVWSYNNGDPSTTEEDNVAANVTEPRSTAVEVWDREVTVAQTGFEIEGEFQVWNFTGTDHVTNDYTDVVVTQTDLGGGVIRTETSTTTGQQITLRWDSRYDTQQLLSGSVYAEGMYIYEIGTGEPTLDVLVSDTDTTNFQEFFPFLPIRLNNKALDHPDYITNGLYEETKKAYRRAANFKNIDSLLADIEDNPSINDIDYAYLMYGCALNVSDQSCRKYIFKFFEEMRQFESAPANAVTQFQADIAQYEIDKAALEAWEAADYGPATPWNSVPARPPTPKLSVPPTSSLNLRTDSPLMPSYDIRLQWVNSDIEQVTGVYTFTDEAVPRPAKKGELMMAPGPTVNWTERVGIFWNFGSDENLFREEPKSMDSIEIYWQIDNNTYRKMTIWGLTHYNYIYGGKSVKITGSEALADNDISGFIVPLHYPTMKNMSIVDYTQMATASVHILFNSYEVTKQKWYQTGIFKILLIIVLIVVAVVIAPGAFAAGGGVLGGNLAVGAALGLTGTAALVAGVVANYLASIIISQVLQAVGTELFGEKWGAVFAAIAGFALSAGVAGTDLMSAEGILGMGNALSNGYAGYVRGEIAELGQELEAEQDEYEEQMKKIEELMKGLGGNDLNFNPMFLTSASRGNGSTGSYMPETSDEFIRRTTMVGSDIVDITHSMVYDFVDVQRTLPRN